MPSLSDNPSPVFTHAGTLVAIHSGHAFDVSLSNTNVSADRILSDDLIIDLRRNLLAKMNPVDGIGRPSSVCPFVDRFCTGWLSLSFTLRVACDQPSCHDHGKVRGVADYLSRCQSPIAS